MNEDMNIFQCNGAELSGTQKRKFGKLSTKLDYDKSYKGKINMDLKLPNFVSSVYHLDDRIKDLLEIASYVYIADRKTSRGKINSVEYQNWDRKFHFFIKVRDCEFWSQPNVSNALNEALSFMSGDKEYTFSFQSGRDSYPLNLFDTEEFKLNADQISRIILFSGGLDSLAGILEQLTDSENEICLISHVSGQPRTEKTQRKLVEKLNKDYLNRCKYYRFYCNLKGARAIEETQRTRSFLYSSIAFGLASAYSQNSFYFYENGITSINFSKRQDMINARASRTTHPKTLKLLEQFYSLFYDKRIEIKHPYFLKTKSDIVEVFKKLDKANYIDSTVSCGQVSFEGQATHCGGCSQCIDRRFAMYNCEYEEYDENGIYNFDFIKEDIEDGKIKSAIIDFIRLAKKFSDSNLNSYYSRFMNELVEVIDFIPGGNDNQKVESVFELCKKHGNQIEKALKRIRDKYDNPFEVCKNKKSLLRIISNKEYTNPPEVLLANEIIENYSDSIRIMFNKNKPKDENDFNDKVEALLKPNFEKYQNEFPTVRFSIAKATPDHSIGTDLMIESKYIRNGTTPSRATEGIAADITKYSSANFILFIIYDPYSKIDDDKEFRKDFEEKGKCKIHIIR